MPNWKKGTPLSEEIQLRLRALICQMGDEKKAAKLLEISTTSVLRGAIGLGMRRGTASLIEQKLQKVA